MLIGICKIVDVGGELVTITIIGVGSEARGGGGVYSLYIPCTYLRQNAHFCVDFSLDGHLKNGHLLSTLFLAK